MSEEYTTYHIIFTILFGDNVTQINRTVNCTDMEAYRLNKILTKKIEEISKNMSTGISMSCRNENNVVIFIGYCNIVGIEHDIPEFDLVDED